MNMAAVTATTPTNTRHTESQILYDLIEFDNPGFQSIHPLANLVFGTPATITTTPSFADTSLLITAKSNSTSKGSVTVQYRRIDLSKFFRGMTLTLDNYQTAGTWTLALALSYFNAKYGVNIPISDFSTTDQAGSFTSGTAKSFTIAASSLCYKGTFTVTWTKGLPALGVDVITDNTLVGRNWPTGLTLTSDTRVQGEYLLYGLDCSGNSSSFEALTSGAVQAAGATAVTTLKTFLLNKIAAIAWVDTDGTAIQYGLGNLTYTRYSLPNAALPEANSAKYNRAMVITGSSFWFKGKFILHYNV
jgi:hypothetical protein